MLLMQKIPKHFPVSQHTKMNGNIAIAFQWRSALAHFAATTAAYFTAPHRNSDSVPYFPRHLG